MSLPRARREANRELFERLVLGLTEPVRRLDELAALGERSVAGDWHARCELRRKVGEIVATVPAVRGAVSAWRRFRITVRLR